jgi:uncharacterized protein (DUF2267 family)
MKNGSNITDWEEENYKLRGGKRSSYDAFHDENGHQQRHSDGNGIHTGFFPAKNLISSGYNFSKNVRPQSLNFEKYAAEGYSFITEVAKKLDCDKNTAGRVTRAVLHAVRDRLPPDDAIEFAQGLPMALKGIFIDQYDVSKTPVRIRRADDFIDFVRLKNRFSAIIDFRSPYDVIKALHAVFYVLENHMDLGQIQQIKRMLPQEIVYLIDQDK